MNENIHQNISESGREVTARKIKKIYDDVKDMYAKQGFISVAEYAKLSSYSVNKINNVIRKKQLKVEATFKSVLFYSRQALHEILPYTSDDELQSFRQEYISSKEMQRQYTITSSDWPIIRKEFNQHAKSIKEAEQRCMVYYRRSDIEQYFSHKKATVKDFFTIQEASDYLGITYATLRQYLYLKKLGSIKVGKKTMFTKSQLDESKKIIKSSSKNHQGSLTVKDKQQHGNYSLKQASVILDLNVSSIKQYICTQKLEATKIGNRYYITQEQIKKFLEKKKLKKTNKERELF